jgi:hypothetical protein
MTLQDEALPRPSLIVRQQAVWYTRMDPEDASNREQAGHKHFIRDLLWCAIPQALSSVRLSSRQQLPWSQAKSDGHQDLRPQDLIGLRAHAAWAVGSRDTCSELANQKQSLTTARVLRHELMHGMASARLDQSIPSLSTCPLDGRLSSRQDTYSHANPGDEPEQAKMSAYGASVRNGLRT